MDALDIIRQIEADAGLRAQLRAVLLGDDFLRLPAEVQKLIEAQARTEQSIQRLTEAQAKTERALQEFQARTEQSIQRLTEAQAKTERALQEFQARTEQSFQKLEVPIGNLEKQVGKLAEGMGATVQTDAQQLIDYLIKTEGLEVVLEPSPIVVNGEIDVYAVAKNTSGVEIGFLCEAKTRLKVQDVDRFKENAEKLAEKAKLPKVRRYYLYGFVIYAGVPERAKTFGFGVISPRGELIKPSSK
jgi:hypothetical protein